MSSFFFSFSQKDSLKTIKVKRPYVFEIADFYSLISNDTSQLSFISNKYYSGDKGTVAGKCNNNTPDEVLNFINPDMITQVCFVNGRIQSIKVRFNSDNFMKRSVILSQLEEAKFTAGMINKSSVMISTEYINSNKTLFIETKCKEDDVVFIRFN
jgi:hypothetical protein